MIDNSNVAVVVFSKNRALQLDACLNSFYKAIIDNDFPHIKVIYKCDKDHRSSYEQVAYEHPYPEFIEETNFKQDLFNAVNGYKYTLFLVDDSIFFASFCLVELIETLEQNNKILGASLRLGKNTDYCYSLNTVQPVPFMYTVNNNDGDDNLMAYIWPDAYHDFGYAVEVSSSLYRTEDILIVLKNVQFNNPNELESALYSRLFMFRFRPRLLCYEKSVACSLAMNRVQNIAKSNRWSQDEIYEPNNLLKFYEQGLRIDYEHLFGLISPNAAHCEVDFLNYLVRGDE